MHDFLPAVRAAAQRIVDAHADRLTSMLAYPHPFTAGGVVVVWQDEAEPWLDLVAAVQTGVPSRFTHHCLRRSELPLLSRPNLFAPPLQVGERVHLPYWLQHKGHVLFGDDLRHHVRPVAPRTALAGHLEGCLDYLRRYGILTLLMQEKYGKLQAMLEREMRYLMGTALLLHGDWDVTLQTLPARFRSHFSVEYETWQQLAATTAVSRQSAYRAVWLFEQFVRQLRVYL